ncbi:2862_t:CDS:1, partial [Ambispora leptoticha]
IHGPDFAVAIIKVILNTHISENITEIQKKYINELVNDIKNKKQESFGLFEALNDNDFQEQFLAFSQSIYAELPNYPLIHDFIKYRIWPIIVHQQHLEGMFNKYDLKTHPNMSINLQESRMQLSEPKPLEISLTQEKLSEIRLKNKRKRTIIENNSINNEESATEILQ